MVIRKMIPTDDFPEISQVYASCWKKAYEGIISANYLDNLPADRWVPFLKEQKFPGLLALDGNRYVGTASYASGREASMSAWGEIISMYILPPYQRQGIGKKLMEHLLEELFNMEHTKIYLWVLAENQRARRFYEKNGFIASRDRETIQIGDEALEEIRYIQIFK